jgi:nucleotide-binding universal stress UspA family protein
VHRPVKKLLLPVKGYPCDEDALRLACRFAAESKGLVYVLYVIQVPRSLPLDAEVPAETDRGEQVLRRMEELARGKKSRIQAEILQAREAASAVVQEALVREVEMIVVGLPYRERHGQFSLGETVPYILRNAPCPVLVWREPRLAEDGP